MAFLAQADIKKLAEDGKLFADRDYDLRGFKQASYDLRLGEELYIVGRRAPEKLTQSRPYSLLAPGQFAILTTQEIVTMPDDLLAMIAIRTKFKLQGLVNISGFHVDPSYKGRLIFAVQNVGPTDIRIKLGEPTFTIFFCELTSSKIGDSRDDQKSEVHFKQNLTGIRLEDVQLLGGSSLTLSELKKDVDRLKMLLMVYGPFAVAAFLALLIKMFQ